MADEIVIGKIGLTPKGEYVPGELYDILDMVSHEGNSYVSKIQNNNVDITNTEAWLLAAEKGGKGDKGDTGDTFNFDDLTAEQKEELKGDVIIYNSMTEADKDDLASRVPITGVIEEGNTQAVSGGEVYKLGVIFDNSELITANTSNCEIGSISSDGSSNVSRDDRFRFNDYFNCEQGAEIKCPNGWDMGYHIYDENKVQIGNTRGWFSGTHIVEPCSFLRVKFKKSNDDVIVLSDITSDFSVNVKNNINLVKQNTEDIASFEKVNHKYIEILGESVPINRNSNDNGTFYYTNQKILQNRRIKTIEVNITTAGTFSVVKGENLYRDEYTEEIIGVFDVTEGLNILPVDFHLNYGEFIGFGSYTDTATFGYNWVVAGVGNYNGNPIFGGFSYKNVNGDWVSSINDLNIKIGVELNSISQNNIKPLTLTGKKISFLGDSITTYAGFIPAGSAVYYPNGDVDVVDKTWWHRLIKQTGMVLDVNNSWSGSTISGSGASAFTSRVSNIGTPDICLIFGGTNDYRDDVPIGDWNYDDTSFDTSQFKQSVQKLLYELLTNYQDTRFIFIVPLHRNDNAANRVNGFPVNWNKTKYLRDYQEAIIEACITYGIEYIDTRQLFSYYNVKHYTLEGLHPNYYGMEMIADYVESKLR